MLCAWLKELVVVRRADLNAELYDKIKRDLTIQVQRFRSAKSTKAYFEKGEWIYLPRIYGYRLLRRSGFKFSDQRSVMPSLPFTINYSLLDRPPYPADQSILVRQVIERTKQNGFGGFAVAPTGSGKTLMGTYIAAALGGPTLIVVHKTDLIANWVNSIQGFSKDGKRTNTILLEGKTPQVGFIQGKRCATGHSFPFVIATAQSLAQRKYPKELYNSFRTIEIDESHHVPCKTALSALYKFKAKYIIGVTATLRRKDGTEKLFSAAVGDVLYTMRRKSVIGKVFFVPVPFLIQPSRLRSGGALSLAAIGNEFATLDYRNELLIKHLLKAYKEGHKVLLLSLSREHLSQLYNMLPSIIQRRAGFYIGGRRPEELKAVAEKQIMLATMGMASEGMDVPCLPTDEKILTQRGMLPIQHIKVGDKVVGKSGKFQKVQDIYVHNFKGYLIEIRAEGCNSSLRVTPNHRVLAIKSLPCTHEPQGGRVSCKPSCWHAFGKRGGCSRKLFPKYKLSWIPASHLQPYDFATLPTYQVKRSERPYKTIDLVKYLSDKHIEATDSFVRASVSNLVGVRRSSSIALELGVPVSAVHHFIWTGKYKDADREKKLDAYFAKSPTSSRYRWLPRNVLLDGGFCRLLGYFIAEGSTGNGGIVYFSFHNKELAFHQDVFSLMRGIFGLRGRIERKGNCVRMVFCSSLLAHLFGKWCGSGSRNKHLPDFVDELDFIQLSELIRGMWRGDAYKKYPVYGTSSETLAYQMKVYLSRLGIFAGISYATKRQFYSVYVSGVERGSFSRIFNEWNPPVATHKIARHSFIWQNKCCVPITSVKKVFYEGPVYDLRVDTDASFLTKIGIVHNSLDCLILSSPIKDVEQSVGRILREHADKLNPIVIDFVDKYKPLLRWARERLSYYSREGFTIQNQLPHL